MAEQIDILSPDGVLGTIDPTEVDNALAQGFKIPEQADYSRVKNEEVASGLAGKAAAFSGSALNAVTFGGLEEGLKAYAPEYAKALETSQKVNPNSSMAGTATGVGLSFLNPAMGAVGKAGQAVGGATETALQAGRLANVANIAGKTAQFATEGSLLALPVASVKASIGDYEAATETLLMGGGLGAGLGLGVGYLPTLLKVAGTGIEKTGSAVGSVVKPATNYLADSAKAFEKDQGGKILGITKAIRSSKKMGNSRADELIEFAEKKGILKGFDNTERLAETVGALKEKAGEEIGKIVKAIDGTGKYFVDTRKIMTQVTSKAKLDIPEGALASGEVNTYNRAIEDISSALLDKKGDPKLVKLQVLQELRKKLGDYAYKKDGYGQILPGKDVVADLRGIVDNVMKESIEFAEKTIPDQAKRWQSAKLDYKNYADLIEPLQNKIASEYGNQFVRPSDMAGAIAGGTVAGIPGAIVGYSTNALRQRYGAQLAYKTVSAINRAVEGRAKLIDQAVDSFLSAGAKLPRRLAVGGDVLAPTSLGILNKFVNEEKATRAQNLEKFTEELTSELANPAKLQERLGSMTGGMASLDPELGAGVYQRLIATTKYLQEKAPKGMNVPTALSPARFIPSDRDISSYERRVRAAVNPYTLLLDLNKGILSPEALETVKDLYPSFYGQVQNAFIEKGSQAKGTIPYAKRLQISAVLGTQLDGLSGKQNQDALQQNFATENQQQAQQAKLKPNSQIAGNFQTDIQRISNK